MTAKEPRDGQKVSRSFMNWWKGVPVLEGTFTATGARLIALESWKPRSKHRSFLNAISGR